MLQCTVGKCAKPSMVHHSLVHSNVVVTDTTQHVSQPTKACLLLAHWSAISGRVLQPSGPANLVKPSGRLEREVAPDLGLSGAAQLGIQVSSHQRPSSSQPAAPPQPSSSSRQASAASQRSHSQPSTSGRCALSCTVTPSTACDAFTE